MTSVEQEVDEPVEVVAADPRWGEWCEAERQRIHAVLGDTVRIEHFGSTAVPGLDARPIIDILVGAPQRTDLAAVASDMVPLGYACLGEAGVAGRLYLRRRGIRSFNISLTTVDGPLWEDNLMLRDFLRASPDGRRKYMRVKRAALATGRVGLLDYSHAKSSVVEELLHEARAWRAESYE